MAHLFPSRLLRPERLARPIALLALLGAGATSPVATATPNPPEAPSRVHSATGTLTLPEALRLAGQYHPDLAGAALRVDAARAKVKGAGQHPNPELALRGDNFGGGLGASRGEASVSLGQTFELGGKASGRTESAAAESRLAGAALEERRRLVAGETGELFVNAWLLQERSRGIARLKFSPSGPFDLRTSDSLQEPHLLPSGCAPKGS